MKKRTLVLITAVILSTIAHSQGISMFPLLPPAEGGGFNGSMIEFHDSLYFEYQSSVETELVKFNGSTYRRLHGQSVLLAGNSGYPFVYNGQLYCQFHASGYNGYQIGRINSDTTKTLFVNPDEGVALADSATEYNGKMYFVYTNASLKHCLGEFDGTTVRVIPQPDDGDGFYGKPVVNNGFLYMRYWNAEFNYVLAKFDGTSTTLIDHRPSFGYGIESDLIVYNSDLYFIFNDSVCRYDGNNLTIYPNPQYVAGFSGGLIVYHNKIWYKVYKFFFSPQYQLATFDGNSVELIGLAYDNLDFGFYNPFIYQDQIYFGFQNTTTNIQLARINGSGFSKIPNLNDVDEGYYDYPVIYRDKLYFQYRLMGSEIKLASYDGLNLTVFQHPISGRSYYADPVVYNGSLYFGYLATDGVHLAKLTDSIINTSLCANGNVMITSNVIGTSYQWQRSAGGSFINITDNGNYAGSNTISLSLSNIPSDWYGYSYRCMVDGVSTEVYQLRFINNWTEAVNTSWENSGNWSCGVVPDLNTDVVIDSGHVVVNANATVHSLHINENVTFTINPGIDFVILH